jgi:hypothetical protein
MKIKRGKIFIGLIFWFILCGAFLANKSWGDTFNIITAQAEDDEEDERGDDEDERVPIIDTDSANDTPRQAETKTIYEKLSDTITRITETKTQFDSDGDGIFDEQDKNPTINDGYIVKDANLNGIDDQYEQRI